MAMVDKFHLISRFKVNMKKDSKNMEYLKHASFLMMDRFKTACLVGMVS